MMNQANECNPSCEPARSWASAQVDVLENADQYVVFADVPGVAKEDLKIEYEKGQLSLMATRKAPSTEWPTDFRRVFTVGSDVNVEGITAELKHGVLQVTLPKLEARKPRQITIQGE